MAAEPLRQPVIDEQREKITIWRMANFRTGSFSFHSDCSIPLTTDRISRSILGKRQRREQLRALTICRNWLTRSASSPMKRAGFAELEIVSGQNDPAF